jgi:hypothetical protein
MTSDILSFQKILKRPEMVQSRKTLLNLIESLENKNDPDNGEILLMSELYQVFEKFSKIDSLIEKMNLKNNKQSFGNKLDDLWKNSDSEIYKYNY